jgi:elongation factor 2
LEQAVYDAIKAGEIKTEGKIKDPKALAKQLQDLGMDRDEARGIVSFKDTNVFMDITKGIQYLNETLDLAKQAFEEAMTVGPLAQEKSMGLKIRLVDAKLHEDGVQRRSSRRFVPASTGRCAWESGSSWNRSRRYSSMSLRI